MAGVGIARWAWAGALAAGAGAVGLAVLRDPEGRAADAELFAIVNRGHGPAADAAATAVTELGSLWAAGAAAAAMAAAGLPRQAARAAAAAGTTWLLLQGMKRLTDRPRPSDAAPETTRLMIARPMATSWPSSHPAVLTTFTRVAARELGLGPGARRALGALDGAVAASRVYVGVHYPGDVTSGLLLGRAVARVWPRGRR